MQENRKPTVALYLDMDGCFTDFTKSAYEVFEHFHILDGVYSDQINCVKKKQLRDDMVEAIKAKPDFWHTLPWIKGGLTLAAYVIANFDLKNVTMLTAPMGSDPNCHDGKRYWMRNNLPEIKNIIIDDDKYKYVGHLKGDVQILIDDREKNIDLWTKAGGIGILHHHNTLNNTLTELSKHI